MLLPAYLAKRAFEPVGMLFTVPHHAPEHGLEIVLEQTINGLIRLVAHVHRYEWSCSDALSVRRDCRFVAGFHQCSIIEVDEDASPACVIGDCIHHVPDADVAVGNPY